MEPRSSQTLANGSGPFGLGPIVPRRKPSSTSNASPKTVNGMAIASDSMLGVSSLPANPEHGKTDRARRRRRRKRQQPDRQVAVVDAFHRHREFRIGEGEIDDGAEPVALDLLGDEMRDQFGDGQHAHRRSRTSGDRCGHGSR